MATADYFKVLFAYDAWANGRILDTAAQLDPAALEATLLPGLGSLRSIFVHTMGALWAWRSRLEGDSPSALLDPAGFPTLAAIRERWEAESQAFRTLIATYDDTALTQEVAYRTTDGKARTSLRWHALAQLANHGTHHRSEAAALLTALGYSPGDIDLIVFLRSLAQ